MTVPTPDLLLQSKGKNAAAGQLVEYLRGGNAEAAPVKAFLLQYPILIADLLLHAARNADDFGKWHGHEVAPAERQPAADRVRALLTYLRNQVPGEAVPDVAELFDESQIEIIGAMLGERGRCPAKDLGVAFKANLNATIRPFEFDIPGDDQKDDKAWQAYLETLRSNFTSIESENGSEPEHTAFDRDIYVFRK